VNDDDLQKLFDQLGPLTEVQYRVFVVLIGDILTEYLNSEEFRCILELKGIKVKRDYPIVDQTNLDV